MMSQISYVHLIRKQMYVTIFALIDAKSIDAYKLIHSAVDSEARLKLTYNLIGRC